MRNTHPIIKSTPPIGVIIPSDFIPVIARIYKLPENRIIPNKNDQPDIDNEISGWILLINPKINRAIEWSIWYNTALL